MQPEVELLWTVIETSPTGDTVVGVYTTLGRAREIVSSLADGRFEDYRIEGHVPDETRHDDQAWQVHLKRDGGHLETVQFAGCSCADDVAEFLRRSFVARDAESMSVIVFAPTPGRAIAAADRYRDWLLDQGLWASALQLEPIQARPAEVGISA